jgi:hypothetical protein
MSFDFPRDSIEARDAGAAVVLPILTTLCFVGQGFLVRVFTQNMSVLIAHRRGRTLEQVSIYLKHIILTNVKRALPFIFGIMLFVVAVYFSSQGLILADTGNQYRYILLLQALPLWISILCFAYTVLVIYMLMHRHIAKNLRVRLFEIEKMQPLSNIVLASFSVASALVSVYAMQVVVINIPLADIILISTALMLTLGLLIWPLVVVRAKLYESRENTVDRLNESLNIQLQRQPETKSTRRLVDDNIRMQFISDLLLVRKEVAETSLFPINLPFTSKLVMLMLLPFVSWVGAALVSQMLKVVVPV